jgi:hypothetical protein
MGTEIVQWWAFFVIDFPQREMNNISKWRGVRRTYGCAGTTGLRWNAADGPFTSPSRFALENFGKKC